jgi:hypothetical protein
MLLRDEVGKKEIIEAKFIFKVITSVPDPDPNPNPDPDSLVRDMDPDSDPAPDSSIILLSLSKNCKKTHDSYLQFCDFFWIYYLCKMM